jgi:hypothetical protein
VVQATREGFTLIIDMRGEGGGSLLADLPSAVKTIETKVLTYFAQRRLKYSIKFNL